MIAMYVSERTVEDNTKIRIGGSLTKSKMKRLKSSILPRNTVKLYHSG